MKYNPLVLESLVERLDWVDVVKATAPKILEAGFGECIILIAYDRERRIGYMQHQTSFIPSAEESRAQATCRDFLETLKRDYSDLSRLEITLAGDTYEDSELAEYYRNVADQRRDHRDYRSKIVRELLKAGIKKDNIKERWSRIRDATMGISFNLSNGRVKINVSKELSH